MEYLKRQTYREAEAASRKRESEQWKAMMAAMIEENRLLAATRPRPDGEHRRALIAQMYGVPLSWVRLVKP